MSSIDAHISVKKDVRTNDDLDFEFLRSKGLEYIEQLGSKLWTDYNSHDPGITILEMLCYAITDLGLRIDMPIENLLAPEKESSLTIDKQFLTASQILPNKSVNELDYRKLLIDIDGVKNCWLKRYEKTVYVDCKSDRLSYDPDEFQDTHEDFKRTFSIQGLYTILVDFDVEESTEGEYEEIKEKIKEKYHQNRNLCEDLINVAKVETHPISVCTRIDILPEADEELVHANVLRAIKNYFSPSIKFYSLKQLFDKDYTSDEVFEGPLLDNGFIDTKELENAELRREVRLSDIMQIIMNIEGVKVIREITIGDCNDKSADNNSWIICVEEGKKPVLCKDSAFSYSKGLLPVNINKSKVEEYIKKLDEDEKDGLGIAKLDKEITVPEGAYLNTEETTTIQNDFPDTYGIGKFGLPSRETIARKSQAKQLKAYLLFFDQILAGYFAHLAKVKDLLAVDSQLTRTYFTQPVNDIKGFEELIKKYETGNNDILTDALYADPENNIELDNRIERKNKLLDHLIARFAERFSDYAFLMKQLYGNDADKEILKSKESFLKDYETTSKERGCAFNYYKQIGEDLWDTPNV